MKSFAVLALLTLNEADAAGRTRGAAVAVTALSPSSAMAEDQRAKPGRIWVVARVGALYGCAVTHPTIQHPLARLLCLCARLRAPA